MKHFHFLKQIIVPEIVLNLLWKRKINYAFMVKYCFKLVFAKESSLRVSSL